MSKHVLDSDEISGDVSKPKNMDEIGYLPNLSVVVSKEERAKG